MSLTLNDFLVTGENYQKDSTSYGMYRMQVPKTDPAETMQALRIGWRQETQRTNDSVLSC